MSEIKTGNANLDKALNLTTEHRIITIAIDEPQDVATILGKMPNENKDLRVLAISKGLWELFEQGEGENDVRLNRGKFVIAKDGSKFGILANFEFYLSIFKENGGAIFIWDAMDKNSSQLTEIMLFLRDLSKKIDIAIIVFCAKSKFNYSIFPTVTVIRISDIALCFYSETNEIYVRKNTRGFNEYTIQL